MSSEICCLEFCNYNADFYYIDGNTKYPLCCYHFESWSWGPNICVKKSYVNPWNAKNLEVQSVEKPTKLPRFFTYLFYGKNSV